MILAHWLNTHHVWFSMSVYTVWLTGLTKKRADVDISTELFKFSWYES